MKGIVVVMTPRSGSSLCMDCLGMALGYDRIIGDKFPQAKELGKQENETEAQFELRKYVSEKFKSEKKIERQEKTKHMNPNGFYESKYLHGIKDDLSLLKDNFIVKMMPQGLSDTDIKYVAKVVLLLRHPMSVAKSQEDLLTNMEMPSVNGKQVKHNSVKNFIIHNYQVAKWAIDNPEIPIFVLRYESLLADPNSELKRLEEYLGEGDFSTHPVDPKLFRSKTGRQDEAIYSHAIEIHRLLSKNMFLETVKYFEEHKEDIFKEDQKYLCTRLEKPISYNVCANHCQNKDCNWIKNKIKEANKKGIKWKNEPCVYEVKHGIRKNIEESVLMNHWVQHQEEFNLIKWIKSIVTLDKYIEKDT